MNELLSNWLGKILFAIALVWAIAAAVMNRPVPVEYEHVEALKTIQSNTQVKLKVTPPDASGMVEAFFVTLAGDPEGPEHKVFPTVVEKIAEYESVSLEIPDASIMRGPMVMPSPGPALPGSAKLPRWGEEMPPLPAPPDPKARPIDPLKTDPLKNPPPATPPEPAKKPG